MTISQLEVTIDLAQQLNIETVEQLGLFKRLANAKSNNELIDELRNTVKTLNLD